MTEYEKLSLSFLQNHPNEASQVLEGLPVEDVAQFLEKVPTRICTNVVSSMIPSRSAKIFQLLDEDKRLSLFRDLSAQLSAHILRHSEKPIRSAILKQLPTSVSFRIKMLLNYPHGSVGATMNPVVKIARAGQTVREAMELLQDVDDTQISHIYIVDGGQKLKGYISVAQLIISDGDTLLKQLIQAAPPALQARSSISTAIVNPAWKNHVNLPVLDRDDRIIGELPLSSLTQSVEHDELIKEENIGMVMGNILDAYWTGWLSMLDIIFSHSKNQRTGR